MSGYTIRKISELAVDYGEDFVSNVVSAFTCRFNAEVDDFLFSNALDFARRKVSVTELVFDNASQLCAGYFTLAVKPLQIQTPCSSTRLSSRCSRSTRGFCDEQ